MFEVTQEYAECVLYQQGILLYIAMRWVSNVKLFRKIEHLVWLDTPRSANASALYALWAGYNSNSGWGNGQ